jgi:hypothetical protein
MDCIRITLVQTAEGRLVGRTASDRWNMDTILGVGHKLWADRNSIAVKRLRRIIQREFGNDLAVQIGRGCIRDIVERPSKAEVASLGPALASVVKPEWMPILA